MTPAAVLTVVTLGVADMRRSIQFYDALGLKRRMKATGEDVAFFAAGGIVIGLWSWDSLAEDAGLSPSLPATFRGATLAWNCATPEEVDAAFAHALKAGARRLKAPEKTFYGGYRGYFADPDGHVWEVVQAPGIEVTADGRVMLPD
jgi:catechol 2,3-dioxygenase-like lactoylglutathione lyase family enzyme